MGRVLAVIASTLGWPAVQLAVFVVRFRHLPPGGAAQSFVFAPMGFAAGVVAVALAQRASSRRQRLAVTYGYLVASPLAFIGSLLGGLVLSPVVAPLVFGGIPLALGCIIGFAAGSGPASKTRA